jgi:hypothetical protein
VLALPAGVLRCRSFRDATILSSQDDEQIAGPFGIEGGAESVAACFCKRPAVARTGARASPLSEEPRKWPSALSKQQGPTRAIPCAVPSVFKPPSPHGKVAVIGDENAGRVLERMEHRMPERRRFTQTTSLEVSLADEAKRLRKQAQGTPPGIERERLVRRAREPRKLLT